MRSFGAPAERSRRCEGSHRGYVATVGTMLIALGDRSPVVPDSAWVAPTATLVGSAPPGRGCLGVRRRRAAEAITSRSPSARAPTCRTTAVPRRRRQAHHPRRGRPGGPRRGGPRRHHRNHAGRHGLDGDERRRDRRRGAHRGRGAGHRGHAGAAALAGGRRSRKVRRELTDDEVAGLHLNAAIYEQHRELHAAPAPSWSEAPLHVAP